jgi:hypothetical protein
MQLIQARREMRTKVLLGNSDGKRSIGRRHRWEIVLIKKALAGFVWPRVSGGF